LLLAADFAAAGLHEFLPRWGGVLIRFSFSAGGRPVRYFAGLVIASALAYVPLAVAFTPSAWVAYGPFGFQLSRPLHYVVYFFAGVGVGACGIEHGLFASDGVLVRRWRVWPMVALGSLLLWMALTALTMAGSGSASLGLQILDNLSFVLACFSSCFFVLALALRFAGRQLKGVGRPQTRRLWHVSGSLWVCRVAAVCPSRGRAGRSRKGLNRIRWHPVIELGHHRRHPANPAGCSGHRCGSGRGARWPRSLRYERLDALDRAPRLPHY
jgi:hypothetical protein